MVIVSCLRINLLPIVLHTDNQPAARGPLIQAALEGLGYRSPWLAALMFLFLLGLTGLPPTAGFVGKFFIFKEVFGYSAENGSSLFFWCGVIGLLNAPIGLYYYMRVVVAMFISEATERTGL